MPLRLSTWIVLLLTLVGSHGHAQGIEVVTEETTYGYLRDGRVVGPASAVVEATLQRAGLNDYHMAVYPWARAYDMALQQPNVLIYLIARNPAREPLFHWVGEVLRVEYHLYRLRGQEHIQVHSLADAKRYRIGVQRGDVRQQYLKGQGFTKLVVSAHERENFRRLLNHQVQLMPLPERDAAKLCAEAGIDPARLERVFTLDDLATGLYMAYSRSTAEELVARSRAAFASLEGEGLVSRMMMDAP
ncbi:substrate-binding periplasmic protein [Pseudomonas zhanjiangensis]|uniref:Substrate-binding periplasmic protein n=1 Tax=Pseudomonas zhanjiangensis TaxID=3239015 RepID=A0ABV3YXN8_9PSED